MNHFYIITNESKDPDFVNTGFIKSYLESRGKRCSVQKNCHTAGSEGFTDSGWVDSDVDCILVLGGDGTLLQAAADLAHRHIPFLGINLGTLGFMTEVNMSGVEAALDRLLQSDFEREDRMMLQGAAYSRNSIKDENCALNDIVITRKGSMQIINFNICVNGQFLHRYSGDGVIVATPTGSTGYNLSAGGPVVEPCANLILITPICPHSMKNRSIILSPEDIVTIEIENSREGDRLEVEAIFDGSHKVSLCTGDKIKISKSEKTTGIIKLNKVSFLEILHTKLSD